MGMPPCLTMLAVFALFALLAPALGARLPYIVNGVDARIGEFPWQGSLQLEGQGHICGCSLVSDEWIVTASHCIVAPAEYFTVVLGAHDKDTLTKGSPIRYEIEQIYVHEGYIAEGPANQPNDITLIKLKTKVDLSGDYISPIALPKSNEGFSECKISGWGSLYGIGTELPNVLQKLDVLMLLPEQCERLGISGVYHTCVYDLGSSACSGDSGGPLACKQDGEWTLFGAASFVFGNCAVWAPTVYTNVFYYREWINDISGL